MERRLAAILAADVVEYSRLMGDSEEETLKVLKSHRENLIGPKISQHNGRIVDFVGDNALAEFASVVDAVACAVEIQAALAACNADVPDNRRFHLRIGINLGDVIVEAGSIYGDGIIVAARLEALAEPGGICLSRAAYDQVRDKLDLSFEDLDKIEVKGIARPVQVFRVLADGETAQSPTVIGQLRNYRLATAACVALVLGLAGFGWWQPWKPDVAPARTEKLAYPLPDKPSIAVLAFDNLGKQEGQISLSDAISENIITELSRARELFVISRNSSFSYKGKSVEARTVAEELGVRYLIEGSLQRSGNRGAGHGPAHRRDSRQSHLGRAV